MNKESNIERKMLTNTGDGYFDRSKKLRTERECLKFNEVTSLVHMAVVRTVVEMWKSPDLRQDILSHASKYRNPIRSFISKFDLDKGLSQLCCRAYEKSKLDAPGIVQEWISNLIMPVGLRIISWIADIQHRYFENSPSLIDSLSWTPEGLIDRANTFFLRSELMYKKQAFYYACEHCLEDFIVDLRNGVLPNVQAKGGPQIKRRYNKTYLYVYWRHFYRNKLPSSDSIIFNNSVCSRVQSIHANMLALAIDEGNLYAVKYFFNKLSVIESSDCLSEWINEAVSKCKMRFESYIYQQSNERTDIVIFLISQVKCAQQQKNIISSISHDLIPAVFYDYHWQKYLIPILNSIWDSLSEIVFIDLLRMVGSQIVAERSNEPQLFLELWSNCPYQFKKVYIRPVNDYRNILWISWQTKNFLLVKSILMFLKDEEKKSIMVSLLEESSEKSLLEAVFHQEYTYVDFILNETANENQVIAFKDEFASKFGSALCVRWLRNNNWKAVKYFVRWCYNYSEHHIDKFKYEMVDKIAVTSCLMNLGDIQLVDKFWKWSFRTMEEIDNFKPKFAYLGYQKVLGKMGSTPNDWERFLKFVNICFSSEDDIRKFRNHLSSSEAISNDISELLMYDYGCDFVSELVTWCFHEDYVLIKEFKSNLLLRKGVQIFSRFVMDLKVNDSEFNPWKLIRKLAEFFSPLQKDVVEEFKQIVLDEKDNFFGHLQRSPFSAEGERRALFYLLDNFSRRPGKNAFNSAVDDEQTDDEDSEYKWMNSNGIYDAHVILSKMCDINDVHYNDWSEDDQDVLELSGLSESCAVGYDNSD